MLSYLRNHDAVHVSFSHEIGLSFETVEPSLFSLVALAQVVEDKHELFRRSAKHDFIFSTVKLIVIDLEQLIIDKDIAVYDVEHASEVHVFYNGMHQSHRIEVVDAAVLLYYEATFNQLANLFVNFRRLHLIL